MCRTRASRVGVSIGGPEIAEAAARGGHELQFLGSRPPPVNPRGLAALDHFEDEHGLFPAEELAGADRWAVEAIERASRTGPEGTSNAGTAPSAMRPE